MTDAAFRPVLYVKQDCPFCLKVRLFALEAGVLDAVEVREFAPNTPGEQSIRSELAGVLDKVSFPAAQIAPGRFIAESDAIVASLGEMAGRGPAELPIYSSYIAGALTPMLGLYKENMALKSLTQ